MRYPKDEVMSLGLTAAQDLMTLTDPTSLHDRRVIHVPAKAQFFDLRVHVPDAYNVLRVMVGRYGDDLYSESTGGPRQLHSTSIDSFITDRSWLASEGLPKRFFRQGRYLIGLHPRPALDTDITLVVNALPPPLILEEQESLLTDSKQSLIAQVAASLLILKEGQGEVERGLGALQEILQVEGLGQALSGIRRIRRDSPGSSPVTVEESA